MSPTRKKTTHRHLSAMKRAHERIVVVTAYDHFSARIVEQAGVDVILVGDSLGMVVQGHDSTLPVTLDDMLYHTACVLAGNFTTILWNKAMRDFEDRLSLPRELLRPYLERTAINALRLGSAALTGSLARGERGTIERDLEGLEGDAFRSVYLAVAEAVSGGEARL